jgi:hypothetical protein
MPSKNLTVLFDGVVLKFVPMMVTVVAIGPDVGVNEVIVGTAPAVTVKLVALVAVVPPTVTVIFPVVAPAGTVVVIEVAVLAVTTAVVPLNLTVLLARIVLKLVPVIITVAPTGPLVGEKLDTVGDGEVVTIKLVALCAVIQFVVTEIGPVIALMGTVVVMLVAVLAVTVAVLLLKNFTTLFAGIVLKFVPVIVTVFPIEPEEGLNNEMVGGGGNVPGFSFCTKKPPEPAKLNVQKLGSKSNGLLVEPPEKEPAV